ncbi:MAG: hypothetical protein ABI721_03670 [Candidatus Dojkabacteria bacterium]
MSLILTDIKKMKLNLKKNLIFVICAVFFLAPVSILQADDLSDQLTQLQNQIDQINQQKNDIQTQLDASNYTILGYNSQISALYGDAQIYQKSIDEIGLQIKQIELTIQQINQDIEKKQTEIKKNEDIIATLEKESKKRIDESYMKFRMIGANTEVGSNLLFTSNINSYFKNSQYKEVIQGDTNNSLVELARLKAQLDVQKKELNEKLIDQKQQQELVNIKSEDLKQKKSDVDAKMAVFYQKVSEVQSTSNQYSNTMAVLNDEQAQINAQAELIKQQIIGGFSSLGNGQLVLEGTIIGLQGCTGYCFGPHLHFSTYINGAAYDPCGQLESGGMGCGVGGPLKSPLRGQTYFNSAFGQRCFFNGSTTDCTFHDGIDVSGTPWNAPVYAPMRGYLYKGLDCYHYNLGMASSCANYEILCENTNCNVGYKLGFWHLSQM